MVTTTVRFDVDLWADIERHAERLSIARAAFIRDATRERVARISDKDQIRPLRTELGQLSSRIAAVESFLTRMRR
jgi:metal-responsive CopG/Arc/MetJ family transcriptional regulator